MKKIVFISLLWVSQVLFAQFHQPVQFSVRQDKLSDTEIEVVFTGKGEPGWHVYGTDIADGGPTRAELTLEKQRGVRPDGRLRATGKVKREMDEMFGMELSFMEGTASFSQKFTLTGGDYEVAGYLTYGACNDENCIPPTSADFEFHGEVKAAPAAKEDSKTKEVTTQETTADNSEVSEVTDVHTTDTTTTANDNGDLWSPATEQLKAFGENTVSDVSDSPLWYIFALGFLGGLVALVTPCVWPVIPMTVSFFLKRGTTRKSTEEEVRAAKARGRKDALTYGLAIILIYVSLGLAVTAIFGASALNSLATNAFFNILFFLMLLTFGASFIGGFELTLPASWTSSVDDKANSTSGTLSIFLMAFTLVLVSFSCTGPIIGFLLVEMVTSDNIAGPTVGMLGFSVALALPFTLFALFPTMLKSAPKSGGWMNVVKVTLGFIELAFSLKFLSVADLAYGWGILDRETFLAIWIVLATLLGAYLIGWIRFPHDEDEYDEMGEVVQRPRTGVIRFFLALIAFAFALYMVPGLWGAPCKAVSAFAPPMQTQDFRLGDESVEARFNDYDEGMAYAKAHAMPVMIDFTGYGCVNCRKMEAAVWTDPQVAGIMQEKYVLITLYVDEKTPLPEKLTVRENGADVTLRTVGDRWSYLQRSKFGANAQPFYVLLDNEGHPLTGSYSYNEDVQAYVGFLQRGLARYSQRSQRP